MASLRISRLPYTLSILNQNRSLFRSKTLLVRRISNNTTKPKSTLKLGFIGASVGALVGAVYSGYHFYAENKTKHFVNEHKYPTSMLSCPDYKPTRQIRIPNDKTKLKLVLFQYQTCPFCCKVRAFLDYYGLSYDVVEVDAVLRQSIKWSDYKKVPILVAKGEDGYYQLNDSSVIISTLGSYLVDNEQKFDEIVNLYPNVAFTDEDGSKKSDVMNKYFLMYQGKNSTDKTTEDIMIERQWRMWADSVLVHMLSPNVYRTFEESLKTFNWFSEIGEWEKHFPAWEVILMVKLGAFAMWLISKRLRMKYNLKDDVRESLYDACDTWVNAVDKKGTPFMGGQYPNLSDLAVYGILNSFEGCDAFQDVLKNTDIGKWYGEMRQVVKKHLGNQAIREAHEAM